MINSITLEVRAGKDLENVISKDNKPVSARVFALHEIYIPGTDNHPEPTKRTLPIYLRFGARSVGLAVKTVTKGSRFVVNGSLNFYHDEETKKDWWSINVINLSPATPPRHQKPDEVEDLSTDEIPDPNEFLAPDDVDQIVDSKTSNPPPVAAPISRERLL